MCHVVMTPVDFVQERFLNQGAFGKVFEATFQKSKERVAVKKLAANLNNEKSLRQEAELLRSVSHAHVVSILGVVDNLELGEIWIVTELLNGGSLRPYCTGCEQLDSQQKLEIGLHCWMALSYLHDCAKITHKDIKPENILLHKIPDGRLVAKLCDFGLAKMKTTMTITEETSVVGTFMYYPPEFAESKRNPQKADVYSLGVTLCELFTNLHFWHNPINYRRLEDCQILYKLVLVNQRQIAESPPLQDIEVQYGPGAVALDRCSPEDCPMPIKEILRRTVHYYRQERPSASKAQAVFQSEIAARTSDLPSKPCQSSASTDSAASAASPISATSPSTNSESTRVSTTLSDNIFHSQPYGTMEILDIKGDSRTRAAIRCTFQIPPGIQTILHPSPGHTFAQTCCTLYLPKSKYARVITKLLRLAFNRKLLFDIGSSGCVVWSFGSDIGDSIHKFDANLVGNWVYTFKEKQELTALETALTRLGIDKAMLT